MAQHARRVTVEGKQPMKLLDRPILSYFIIAVSTLLVMSLFNAVATVIVGTEGTAADMATILYIVPAAFVANLLVNKVFFRGTFDGPFATEGIVEGLKMCIVPIALNIMFCIIDRIVKSGGPMNDLLHVIALSCTAGIMEEMVFRANVLPNLMRLKRDYKGMIFAVVFTSVMFGLIHIINVSGGGSVVRTIQQTVTASITGAFYAAVYLNAGTILPCIIMHTVHDIINLLFEVTTESGALTGGFSLYDFVENVIFSLAELGLAIWFLRPAAFNKIRAIWDRKWHV